MQGAGSDAAASMERRLSASPSAFQASTFVLLRIRLARIASGACHLSRRAFKFGRTGGGALGQFLACSRSAFTLNRHALIDAVSEHVRLVNNLIAVWAELARFLIHGRNSRRTDDLLYRFAIWPIEDRRHRRGARRKKYNRNDVSESHCFCFRRG